MKILLAEDDAALCSGLVEVLERAGHRVDWTGDGQQALDRIKGADLLISDVRMPGLDGLEVLRQARQRQPGLEVLVMTGFGTIPAAVEAMRRGARAYLTKPFDIEELLTHVSEVDELVRLRANAARVGRGDLVGTSAAMQHVYKDIDVAAASDVAVLITGETGAGKELAARAIHATSRRRGGPFVAVNLGALPRELIDAELFGHERGAFTGAAGRKRGRFLLASGGTLFLDEADSLPLDLQPKLLRALESKEVWPLGAQGPERADARIIAATNAVIESLVRIGTFREDLYYRLNVLRIQMPPLRERPEDIPPLARTLLDRAAERLGLAGVRFEISAEALSSLITRPWSGNVRELSNCLERALARAAAFQRHDRESDQPRELRIELDHFDAAPGTLPELPFKEAKEQALEDWSRRTIRIALATTHGNVSEAARRLRMSRTALIRLLNRFDIER